MIDTDVVAARIRAACDELGLGDAATQRLVAEVQASVRGAAHGGADAHGGAGELQGLRAERDALAKQQAEVMNLLKAASPERILHDLRNVLNELVLLKAVTETEGE
jgi:hypothetical protein